MDPGGREGLETVTTAIRQLNTKVWGGKLMKRAAMGQGKHFKRDEQGFYKWNENIKV